MRGDQKDSDGFRTDSPTVRKSNIGIVLLVAAGKRWTIKSSDVTSAFLQSVPIQREIFVRPPKERRIPGIVWRLKKTVYGLADASRGFFLSLSETMTDLGCLKSNIDPAMYLFFKDSQEDEKDIDGIAVSHVDDILHAGSADFEAKVMQPLKQSIKFGSEETLEFRYVGLNFDQYEEGIKVNNDHYVEALELPDMDLVKNIKIEDVMDMEGQTEFRSVVGKLASVAYHSRPDICFDVKSLSSKFGKATKQDLKTAMKRMMKLKAETTLMVYPDLGSIEDWVLVAHGDAGIKSMPDKITSVGGHVILMCNKKTNKACVLLWKSKQIRRKVISSLAGETLAMINTIGEVVYTMAILELIYGTKIKTVPKVIVIDARDLEEAVLSSSLVSDAWLVPDIAVLKQAFEDETVTHMRRVRSDQMLANCLTKKGATGAELLEVMRTGIYELPGGWP